MILKGFDKFREKVPMLSGLYFPEESKIQISKIYEALRHPIYAAVIMLNVAASFSTFTLFSIILCAFFILGFWIHVRFVEEKELLDGFGPSYIEYRRKVPAFFVSPRRVGTFLRCLSKGGEVTDGAALSRQGRFGDMILSKASKT